MNVGDYVRTPKGITKIIDIRDEIVRNSANGNEVVLETRKYVTDNGFGVSNDYKSSPQIIDLIEVGDYINGLRVEKNKYGELYISYVYYGGDIGKQCEVYTNWIKEMQEEDIYMVLTHEQFESKTYRVEE